MSAKRLSLLAGLLAPMSLMAEPLAKVQETRMHAPPPAPPILSREGTGKEISAQSLGTTRYFIGEPTDEEQLYLEYINRARANPPAEGVRLANTTDRDSTSAYSQYAVDLNLMIAELNATNPAPPLSLNSNLSRAARLHSGDMFTNQFQEHTGSNGSVLTNRVHLSGYLGWTSLGENIFSYAESVFHGHAGFEVDWGPGGTGGMQPGRGHRRSIHNPGFREVGIGVVLGSNGSVGPQLVTQDFGTRSGQSPHLTGVAYYDLNTNGFYDLGEGLGGVLVDVSGTQFYAVTAQSGGYSVPVPANGTYSINFSALNLTSAPANFSITTTNRKVDFVPPYSAPVISGSATAFSGQTNSYSSSPVGGATAYRWQYSRLVPYTYVEGGESGGGNVVINASPGYSVIVNNGVRASGSFSFHLAHPVPTSQFLTLNRPVRCNTNSALVFASRLRWATSVQVAQAQVSVDQGTSWQTVWSQAGNGGSGESTFTRRTNSLAAFAGQEIKVRFAYALFNGSYYGGTADDDGLYVDDISISNAEELLGTTTIETAGAVFPFAPNTNGNYALQVSARNLNRFFPPGIPRVISVISPPPSVRVTGTQVTNSQARIDFLLQSGSATGYQLYATTNLANAFALDATATLTTNVPGSSYRFTAPVGTPRQKFYRVRALP